MVKKNQIYVQYVKKKITNNKYIPKMIGIGYFENIFL